MALVASLLASSIAADAAPESSPTASDSVALAGIVIPGGIELPEPGVASIETMVAEQLRKEGFRVLPPSEFDAVWQRRLVESGGYFDIVSGLPDSDKRRAVRSAALLELNELHGIVSLIRPELVIVAAEYRTGKASWDGARETAAPTGSGEVPALSLSVSVDDLSGETIGTARAGIQLLAKHSIWNSKYGPVSKEKLLADDKLLRKAVERAMTVACDIARTAASAPAPPAAALRADTFDDETFTATAELRIEPPSAGARVLSVRWLSKPDDGVAIPPEVRQRYLDELRERLEAGGFWTLPPEAYERTVYRAAREAGGIFDPITGREHEGRRAAVHSTARNRIAETHGAVAFVSAGILVRPARIVGEKAVWDGVSEKVADIATWRKILTTTRGTTKGLSFVVAIEDPDGTPRHVGWGGIQLADRLEKDRFVHVPPEELFTEPELDIRAIDLALQGWQEGRGTSPDEDRP